VQDKQQKQQQLRLFKAESAVRELQDQLKKAKQDKGSLQDVLDKLQQDASELKVRYALRQRTRNDCWHHGTWFGVTRWQLWRSSSRGSRTPRTRHGYVIGSTLYSSG
jgi:hypothetical protein